MMERHKHILVVAQYFYPEQFRINDICCEWIKRGYRVTVLTGIPNYPQGKFFEGYGLFKKRREIWNDIEIIRIPLVARGKTAIQLALNYLSFVISGFIWGKFTRIKPDKVFIYEVSPMTQALVGVWIAKRRKKPCYLYVMDLWPENFEIMTGINSPFVISPIKKMVRYIYKNCEKIFTSSRSFNKRIERYCGDKEKIIYWPQYAEEFYVKKENASEDICIGEAGKFNILFAGNIGEAQGLEVLVECARRLAEKGNDKVKFCIVGDGRNKEALIKSVKDANLQEMFSFYDRIPATKVPDAFAQADASLICLAKNDIFSLTLPAKTQSCLACGKPVVVSADGEVQSVIFEAKCGVAANAGDAEGLANMINKMTAMGEDELQEMAGNAIKYYNENFNKKTLMDKMDGWLDE